MFLSGDCIRQILPFGNEILAIQMNGTEVREIFEMSASALGPDFQDIQESGFLQVSGVRVTIDTSQPAYAAVYDEKEVQEVLCEGSRVRSLLVRQGGARVPIQDDANYTVLVNEYLAGGGDGYAPLAGIPEDRKLRTRIKCIEALEEYVREHSPLSPVTDGRVQIGAGLLRCEQDECKVSDADILLRLGSENRQEVAQD